MRNLLKHHKNKCSDIFPSPNIEAIKWVGGVGLDNIQDSKFELQMLFIIFRHQAKPCCYLVATERVMSRGNVPKGMSTERIVSSEVYKEKYKGLLGWVYRRVLKIGMRDVQPRC